MAGFGKPQQGRKVKRQTSTTKIEEIIRQSLIAYQQGNLTSAKALLDKTIEAHRANSFALGLLATIEKALGNNETAIQLFESSLGINQNNPDFLHNHSDLLQDKDLTKAVKLSNKALEISPDNSKYLERNGYLKWKAGDLDNALKATIKAIEFKPDLVDAHTNLGSIYKDLGNLDQALAYTLKSLELNPDNPSAHMNLGIIYKDLGNLDQALAYTLKSLELKPDNPNAHMNLGEIYFEIADHKKAEEEFDLAIDLNKQPKDSATRGKAACCFIKKDYNQAFELIQSLSPEENLWQKTAVPREAEIKSIIDAKFKKEAFCNPTGEVIQTTNTEDDKSFIKVAYRAVADDLITELYGISTRKLSQTNDARNGSGFCTDFKLLSHTSPQIKQLEADLENIIRDSIHKEPCSLKCDSFFNIFKAGSGAAPHRHLKSQDKKFDLWKHKYSLVYYVDPGDQNCDQPGILKMHAPEIEILPKKGMILIIPATRMHSSCYGGSKNRLMVGANFYAFDANTEYTI